MLIRNFTLAQSCVQDNRNCCPVSNTKVEVGVRSHTTLYFNISEFAKDHHWVDIKSNEGPNL